jgi:hypothetical protein
MTRTRLSNFAGLALLLIALPLQELAAWGRLGHTAIGILALSLIDEQDRRELMNLLGSLDAKQIEKQCNWPDAIRDTSSWKWTEPLHYVNIPRSETSYDRMRDCPNDACITEAIKTYASQLADGQLSPNKRKQAFAWLCHLVGDLHQPLHCGFADDIGGIEVDIVFQGEKMDLHKFWDGALIRARAGSKNQLGLILNAQPSTRAMSHWTPNMVDAWTDESHDLAAHRCYPHSKYIEDDFADNAWQLIQQQLALAAERLALILNASLGEGMNFTDDSGTAGPG